MNRTARKITVTLCAGLAWLSLNGPARADAPFTLRAVIVRAAGRLPGQDKPERADAVTHATAKPVNVYVFAEELAKSLTRLNAETRIVEFSECRDLQCLLAQPATDNPENADIVVFAGSAYYSKLPNQLQALFPKLGEIAKSAPDLVCSSLVAAWFPDTKGLEAAAHAERAFAAAGLQTVSGISLLTPRENKAGITQEALEKAIADFAARLVDKARVRATERNGRAARQ